MKPITKEEFEKRGKLISECIKPLKIEIDKMFDDNPDVNIVEIEREDLPENLRERFDKSADLQNLAGMFRQRISPLDGWYVCVRKGRLYAVRGKRKKKSR